MTESSVALGPGGEFDRIRAMMAVWGSSAWGIGDDAALVHVPEGEQLIVSTDTSVENVHFRRDWLSDEEIGYRAAVAALSDLAAMAANPLGLLLALSIPPQWIDAERGIARGVLEAVSAAGTVIVGGDLSRSSELSLAITVLGSTLRPLRRSGALAGDTIYVTGVLGGPAAALASFESGERPGDWARARFAHPLPRLAEARWLRDRGATAGIDISDGLIADLRHLCEASGAGAVLEIGSLRTGAGITPLSAAASGEEYELIVTAGALDTDEFERNFGVPLTAIGTVGSPATGVVVREGGRAVLPPAGFNHF